MALTVGVATVLDSKEVVVVVTGLRNALALSKAIGKTLPLHRIALINTSESLEEGVNHLVSIILLFSPPNRTHFILKISVDTFCSPAASLCAYSRGRRCYRWYVAFNPLTSIKLILTNSRPRIACKNRQVFQINRTCSGRG
jgi:hypothetical protein